MTKVLKNMYAKFQIFVMFGRITVKKIKSSTKSLLKNHSLPKKNSFSETYIITTPEIVIYERLDSEKLRHMFFIQVFLFTILKIVLKILKFLLRLKNVKAKIVKNWVETNKVKILKNWPSQSPDLNPIEHLWNQLEIRIRKRPNKFKNNVELETTLHKEWNQIPRNIYMNLIEVCREV